MTTCRCIECGLNQWIVPSSGRCRRCGAPLNFAVFEIPLDPDRPSELNSSLGFVIRSIRLKRFKTQADVAASSDVERSMLSRIECNRATPHLTTLARILRGLGIDAVYLRFHDKPR